MREKEERNTLNDRSSYNILQELELERKRIARELHDSTIQMLSMLIYKAEFCQNIAEKDANRTKMELEIMIQVLKESIDDIRNTIFNLHPLSIEDLGLVASLERYLTQLKNDSDIDFSMKVIGNETECNSNINISIYRIIQECCSNVLKHSKATKASVHITYSDSIAIEVEDNGIGFTNSDREEYIKNKTCLYGEAYKNGFGLPMMRERVSLLHGCINIKTSKRGTIVNVLIPLSLEEED